LQKTILGKLIEEKKILFIYFVLFQSDLRAKLEIAIEKVIDTVQLTNSSANDNTISDIDDNEQV